MKGTTVSKRKLEVHTDASLMKKLHKGPMELHAGYSSNDWPGRKSCGTSVSSSAACLGTRRQKGTSGAAEEHGNTANEKVLKVIQASSKGDSQHPAGSQGGEIHEINCLMFYVPHLVMQTRMETNFKGLNEYEF